MPITFNASRASLIWVYLRFVLYVGLWNTLVSDLLSCDTSHNWLSPTILANKSIHLHELFKTYATDSNQQYTITIEVFMIIRNCVDSYLLFLLYLCRSQFSSLAISAHCYITVRNVANYLLNLCGTPIVRSRYWVSKPVCTSIGKYLTTSSSSAPDELPHELPVEGMGMRGCVDGCVRRYELE